MGYWITSAEGKSFDNDSELLWGDGPADIFDTGIEQLQKDHSNAVVIDLMYKAVLGDDNKFTSFLNSAISEFEFDIGRAPVREELVAGIKFSTSILD